MKQGFFETIVGFLVIILSITFVAYMYLFNNDKKSDNGYIVKANFQNVEGIIKGSDIMIAGIKIGVVDDLKLNYNDYSVTSYLRIVNYIKIPQDSSAAIVSSGFLGNKYISITPGIDESMMEEGGQFQHTQSSINLEGLVGKFMYSGSTK